MLCIVIHTKLPFYESGLVYIENSRVTLQLSAHSVLLEVWFQKPDIVLYIPADKKSVRAYYITLQSVVKQMQENPWSDLINDFVS